MTKDLPPDAAKRLTWSLRLTGAGLIGEALLRAFWPLMTLGLVTGAVLASGLVAALTPGRSLWLLGGLALAVLGALILGVARLQLPPQLGLAARRRLDATLPGQPIAALCDSQAIGADDVASRATWQAHQSRMAARLVGVRPAAPNLRLAARDPYALRYMALLAFVMALGFGALPRDGGLAGLLPAGPAEAAIGASWEGWVEPPAYTGKPSLYLNDQPPGALVLPVGSRLSLRFYGRLGDLTLSETVSQGRPAAPVATPDATPVAAPDAAPQPGYAFTVQRDGRLSIAGPGGAAWQISAIADAPPAIRPDGDLTRSLAGDLQQGFVATDDYGIASGRALLVLDLAAVERRHGLTVAPEPRAAIEAELPMPFRGGRTDVNEVFFDNFARHPWAGLPVSLSLSVLDEAGQSGRSQPLAITLPGRRFLDPLAMALIEQRRDLYWSRENAPRVARLLRALSNRPDGFFRREVTYLKLRVLVRRLETGAAYGLSEKVRDEIAEGLWEIAVSIEDANLSDARDRLRRAQERLSEAMKQGASEQELSELMDELREAMRDYTRQMAQQAPEGGDSDQAQNQPGQEITQDDLEAMMDQIEEAMRQGRQDEAQAMLDALREMMENMRVTEGQPGEGGERPGQRAMQGLADSLNRQQGLSDEAFRDLQEQQNPSARAGESQGNVGRDGGQGRGQSHSGEGGEGEGDAGEGDTGQNGAEGALAERQQQLADELGRQRRNLPGAGSEGGDAARRALEDAESAMRGAAEGLAEGDLSAALDRQAEAMEALREGMRQLDNALAEAEREQQGRQGATAGQPGSVRQNDPLGRGPNSRGGVATQAPLEGGADVYRRAQELMDELRRRSGEGERPQAERDYLRRLLDRF